MFAEISIIYFTSKKCLHQPHKKSHYRLYTTAATKKKCCCKMLYMISSRSATMASVCQSVSQNWSTAVYYLLTINSINLPMNIETISNSFCPSFTSYSTYLARSAYLRTKVHGEWCMTQSTILPITSPNVHQF